MRQSAVCDAPARAQSAARPARNTAHILTHDYRWPAYRTVALDLETTSIDPSRDRIIQYGVYGTACDSEINLSAVVDAETDVGRDPYRIPGVTAAECRQARPLRCGHLAALHNVLHGAVVVMHNAPHDWAFICAEFRRHQLPPPVPRLIVCTLNLAKHKLRVGSTAHTLSALCTALGIPLDRAHNAAHDARATFWLYITLANRWPRTHHDVLDLRSRHFPTAMWRAAVTWYAAPEHLPPPSASLDAFARARVDAVAQPLLPAPKNSTF